MALGREPWILTVARWYGITNLTERKANPKRLSELICGHWGIEKSLHYRRDETLGADWCLRRSGHAARVMAILAIGIFLATLGVIRFNLAIYQP